jgi:hypothetical protein
LPTFVLSAVGDLVGKLVGKYDGDFVGKLVGNGVGGFGRPFKHALLVCPAKAPLQHNNCVSKKLVA